MPVHTPLTASRVCVVEELGSAGLPGSRQAASDRLCVQGTGAPTGTALTLL